MDITNYQVLKTASKITLNYIDGDSFGATTKHFDPNLGTETSPTFEEVKISDLQAQVATLQAQITQIEQVITDAQALTAQ